jgi:hypothetical protein
MFECAEQVRTKTAAIRTRCRDQMIGEQMLEEHLCKVSGIFCVVSQTPDEREYRRPTDSAERLERRH